MPWKLKSAAFSLIDRFHAEPALYSAQKYITGRSRRGFKEIPSEWRVHEKLIKTRQINGRCFEFGAGKSLAQNIYLSKFFEEQVVVDLNPMLDIRLAQKAVDRIRTLEPERLPEGLNIESVDDLKRIGITYLAPFDAVNTDFPNGYFDTCISTNTLEHIPRDSIVSIFTELGRIIRADGTVSAVIDYSDHYSHTDNSISALNFHRYSEEEWKRYNHDCHFQNRLLHHDYKALFTSLSCFDVDERILSTCDEVEPYLKEKFSSKSGSWTALSGHFTLTKTNVSAKAANDEHE